MVKIWSEWNVARLVLPVSAIVVLFWTAGLWTVLVYVWSLQFLGKGLSNLWVHSLKSLD